jgi:hypothetical protein
MRGIAIAGARSQSNGEVLGLQIAGGAAIAGERLAGLQIAPFTRAGSAAGSVQIGVVNHAQKGAIQIGVVNYRKEGKGAQIGLVGFAPDTRLRLAAWASGVNMSRNRGDVPRGPTGNVGLRVESTYLVTTAHVGLGAKGQDLEPGEVVCTGNLCGDGSVVVIPGYTIGARLPVSKVWSFELDFQHRFVVDQSPNFMPHLLAFRASAVARVNDRLAFFASAGPEFVISPIDWVQEQISLGVHLF